MTTSAIATTIGERPVIGNRATEHDVGSLDPRDVFMRDLDLPRRLERELVHDCDRDYSLNGSESRGIRSQSG